ncbi:hypothetical protein EZJ55_00840 [Microcystis aeruginosa EAWAG127a]|uniref:Uncharacterized protein n=1 Tax=Microcystis aeruginosa EAWAG127a TaxID=2529855 RepID=A0A5J5M0A4_MICAE|nr:hypothetical protein [Microcystis aeruginosa]KAB0243762.1 hypothetical protein EZJ55_00840 [Microcystis aeruginosa EAWAG127a]
MKPPNNLQSADQAQSEIGQYLEGKNAKAFNFARVIFFSEGISATPFQGQQIYRTDDRRGDFIVLTGQPLTMAEVSGTDKIQTDTLRKLITAG